ncbi:hypothetical protein EVAR_39580_1 [Eumeta japonica]|uniref:CHK kinase-like domain-containing protein n=1 Tax=Eumeta variegata TaxID=151549 RepID=A0A4C1Y611_EUMVA|nr:hypothetical protein EVAR_39580_1 [Eumeta japonica]
MASDGENGERVYKADINDINITAEQRRVLLEIVKREGFVSYDIRIRDVPNEGGNYLGDLSEIDVRGETSKGSSELNLFMKTALRGDKITVLSLNDVYRREMFTYMELSNLFDGLQNEAGIPDGEKFKFVKAYGGSQKSNEELLILENMTRKGYTTSDRMKCVSEHFVECAITTLAKFHALSYVMKQLKCNEFRNITDNTLSTTAIKFNTDAWIQVIKNMEETVKSCVSTPDMVTRLNAFVKRMLEVFPDYHLPDERSVICHGDYRPNNMLVKEVCVRACARARACVGVCVREREREKENEEARV